MKMSIFSSSQMITSMVSPSQMMHLILYQTKNNSDRKGDVIIQPDGNIYVIRQPDDSIYVITQHAESTNVNRNVLSSSPMMITQYHHSAL
jgi:hypothetical protein